MAVAVCCSVWFAIAMIKLKYVCESKHGNLRILIVDSTAAVFLTRMAKIDGWALVRRMACHECNPMSLAGADCIVHNPNPPNRLSSLIRIRFYINPELVAATDMAL